MDRIAEALKLWRGGAAGSIPEGEDKARRVADMTCFGVDPNCQEPVTVTDCRDVQSIITHDDYVDCRHTLRAKVPPWKVDVVRST